MTQRGLIGSFVFVDRRYPKGNNPDPSSSSSSSVSGCCPEPHLTPHGRGETRLWRWTSGPTGTSTLSLSPETLKLAKTYWAVISPAHLPTGALTVEGFVLLHRQWTHTIRLSGPVVWWGLQRSPLSRWRRERTGNIRQCILGNAVQLHYSGIRSSSAPGSRF